LKRLTLLGVLAALLTSASCEFGNIAIPDGEPIIVVHGIMRPDLNRQWILLEQTLTGADTSLTQSTIPGTSPNVPLSQATVSVTNKTYTADPCGATQFTETPGDGGLQVSWGLYWGPLDCPTMRTGDTMELRVETLDGHVVTGTMEVPGARAMTLQTATGSVSLPGPVFSLNRDVDTLTAQIDAIAGHALQLEVHRPMPGGALEPQLRIFVDSTGMQIPGDFTNIFQAFFGQDSTHGHEVEALFRAGRYYLATLALMDERYFEFSRSGNVPLSGRGFINNLTGGMGVFGGVVAESNTLKVTGEIDDPREGVYNLVGTVDGVPVDIDVELYVVKTGSDTTAMSAFVTGQWVLGAVDVSADGAFVGDAFDIVLEQPNPTVPSAPTRHTLSGSITTGSPFSVQVWTRVSATDVISGTKR